MIKKIIGAFLLLLVFGTSFVIDVIELGWLGAIVYWAIKIVVVLMVVVGFGLLID